MNWALNFAAAALLSGFNVAGLALWVAGLKSGPRRLKILGLAALEVLKLGITLVLAYLMVKAAWFSPLPFLLGLALPLLILVIVQTRVLGKNA